MSGRQVRALALTAVCAAVALWLLWAYIFGGLTCGGSGCG